MIDRFTRRERQLHLPLKLLAGLIDGPRIDAAKSIPYFLAQMVNNVTDTCAIGEVYD